MKKCLNCGMENSDDSLFCAGCGTRLPAAPEPEAAQEQNVAAPAPAKKKGLNKKIFIPIAAVLAVVLIVGVVGVVRINGFKNYVAAFEKACNGYLSLGKYESEYEQDMDDAKSIISGFKFW